MLYVHCTGADTGFSSGGGDKSGAKRPKNFLSPPWAPQGGDRGGTVPPLKLHSPKILHHLLNEFTRKYQEKNLCPPPESLRGGTFWLSPPWIAQAGDNSQGGTVPYPPPCIRSCSYVYLDLFKNRGPKLNNLILNDISEKSLKTYSRMLSQCISVYAIRV